MYSNHEIYDQIIQTCETTISINIKNNPLKDTNYDKTVFIFIDVVSPFFFYFFFILSYIFIYMIDEICSKEKYILYSTDRHLFFFFFKFMDQNTKMFFGI